MAWKANKSNNLLVFSGGVFFLIILWIWKTNRGFFLSPISFWKIWMPIADMENQIAELFVHRFPFERSGC